MQTTIKEIRMLTPEKGKFLCNHEAKAIRKKVYLAKDADASQWVEITAEEKEVLEKQWEEETLAEAENI